MGFARGKAIGLFASCAALVGLAGGCGDSDDGGGAEADNAIEFIGRIDQIGPSFSGYGYVTHLAGVDPALLSTAGGGEISERDARVTFTFETELVTRAVVGDSFAVDTEGTASFYLDDDPGASFDQPESFAAGDQVASAALRVQDIVTVYAPNRAVATATGSFAIESASAFDLDGEEASLGEEGEVQRLTFIGRGTRTDALIPEANFDFAGQTVRVEGGDD